MTRPLLYIVIILTVYACSPKKKVITDNEPIPDHSQKKLEDAIEKHNYDFAWFAGKGDMKLVSDYEDISAKTYVRIRKDSIIWGIAKKIGIEGGRILITPNSYALINRIDRTYQRGSTSKALNSFSLDLDFYEVQQLIYGNVMLPDTVNDVQKTGARYRLSAMSGGSTVLYDINARDLTLERVFVESPTRDVTIQYDDYREIEDKTKFAYKRKFTITDYYGTNEIEFRFSKVTLDVPKSTKFAIPPHYEKVD